MPGVEVFPVSAFRLEPRTKRGNLTVDGEQLPYDSIQAQVMPEFVRIVA